LVTGSELSGALKGARQELLTRHDFLHQAEGSGG
jgi:hypothetical protein